MSLVSEVVAAVDDVDDVDDTEEQTGEQLALAEAVATRLGLPMRTVHVAEGPSIVTTDELAGAIAEQLRPDSLLVTRTAHASRWSGKYSVAEHLVDLWGGLTLVLGPRGTWTGRAGPIIVPVNGSSGAERAIGPAAELADPFALDVLLTRVADDDHDPAREYLDALGARTGHPIRLLQSNDHVRALVAEAEERGSAFVVVSSRGDRTVTRPTMSRTTSGLAAEAPCPVLIVGEEYEAAP